MMPSNHLILCHALLLLPSFFPSIRVFSSESALHIRWPKYWSFNFNNSPSNEHLGLISFRMDWVDLLAVQGTLKSLLQYHSSKASILWPSAFFILQLSHPYMTTGKTIGLTRMIFAHKVMSLLFNMLSRLVITFLPRSKCLLISWLQSPSAVILEPRKILDQLIIPDSSLSITSHIPILFPILKFTLIISTLFILTILPLIYTLYIFYTLRPEWKWKSISPVWLFAMPWTVVLGLLQARILEWVAFPFSRASSQHRDRTQVFHIACGSFTSWATREVQEYWSG